ncbi:MAG: DUF2225 domain-containing protein [Spirochaetales bacterium]|nr:DUF2225 domain-containing protein [Spirochaetales bacterium]
MTLFHETQGRCPVCFSSVILKKLRSTEGYVAFDLDYRVYARGADPVRLLIQRCDSCQYTEYVTDFLKDVSPAVPDCMARNDYRALLKASRSSDFPLVALIKAAKDEGPERLAYCYLRASWFAGDLGRAAEEEQYLHQAREQFQRALSGAADSVNAADSGRLRTTYMLAEIHRRLSLWEEARAYLREVDSLEFAVLVRDQFNLIQRKDALRRRAKSSR